MLSNHVSKEQIQSLFKLKAITLQLENFNSKGRVDPNVKKRRRVTRKETTCLLTEKKRTISKVRSKDREWLLPKEKIKLPKRSNFKKKSNSTSVYDKIATLGIGKLILIHSK